MSRRSCAKPVDPGLETESIPKLRLAGVPPTCRGYSTPAAKVDLSILLPNIRGIFLDKIAVLNYEKRRRGGSDWTVVNRFDYSTTQGFNNATHLIRYEIFYRFDHETKL